MPELGPSGSARGAVSNHRPYRDPDTLGIRRTPAAEFVTELTQAATKSERVGRRWLKRQLKRTPEAIRPEVEAGFSIAEACLNQP
jgi:hypothetical protein